MSQTKKIFAFIITLVMIISLFPAVVSADGTSVVYLTVENTTYSAEEGAPWDGKLLDTIPVEITEGQTKIVDVITSGISEEGYSQTGAAEGYITDINSLGEFSSGRTGGWMVSLNDWFINAGIDAFYVSDGDIINVRFTSVGFGEDLGSSWSNNNKNLSDISFSAGELSEDFSSEVYEYTLTIPSGTESIKVTPTAVNKNFQTRTYLNAEFVDGETEKYIEGEAELESIICGLSAPEEIPTELGLYKRTEEIPVSDGDVIYVACGLSYWNSMNNGEFGSGAEEVPGTVYSFNVVEEESEISINAGIYDYTALTYKENNPQCSAIVSENGVVYETEGFAVADGTNVLDALTEIFENAQISYSLDAYNSYISSVGGLSEMDCTSQSGWMVSVNDEFLSVGANEAVLEDGDTVKLHYSVEGWGTDVGSYFTGGPVIRKLVLGGVTTKITSNTVYADENDWTGTTTYYLGEYREGKRNTEIEGDGSRENPFIIPVEVSSRKDITSLTAKVETSLHEKYLVIGEGEGLTNILEPTNYEDDVTFSVETLGGFVKNYYTIELTKKSSGGGRGNSASEEEEVPEEEIPPAEEEKTDITVNFEDTKGHWAESYIERLASQNIINGKTEKSFAPDDKITRAELVTLLYRISGTEEIYETSRFDDVKESDWYMQAISWAKENGIADGLGNGEFRPNEYVTREQTAVFIIRFCEYMGYTFNQAEKIVFTDETDLSDWSANYVSKAQKYGIINGFKDGSFAPKETSTRAQTAKMLCNLIDGASENDIEKTISTTAKNIIATIKEPQVGSIGGEWAIIGLARSNVNVDEEYYNSYYNNLEQYVIECDGILHNKKYTEYSRVILAVTAIGKNPENVGGYNLLIPLGDFEKTLWQGINGPVWALIALDSGNYSIPENKDARIQATREMYIDYILENQNEDGGWSLSENMPSEIDITAMAMQALSNYKHMDKVSIAIDKALLLIQNSQNDNGGFSLSGSATCESSAQVLTAFCMLGIDYDSPEFTKNGKTVLDNLLTYYTGKGFRHIKNGEENLMATEQAFYSLVALDRYKTGKSGLYEMND